jgi:uncharacterized protein
MQRTPPHAPRPRRFASFAVAQGPSDSVADHDEAAHLAGRRLGRNARLALLEDLADGPYEVVPLEAADLDQALDVDRQYADLDLGLTGATIVVIAHRFATTRLLTFDERDFRAVTPLQGGGFVLLPSHDS